MILFKQKDITKEKNMEAGMAVSFLFLLLGLFLKQNVYIIIASVLLFITMTIPQLVAPLTIIWFSLSKILGYISSKIVLTVVFCTIIVPVSIIRRIFSVDPMKVRRYKVNSDSTFKERNYVYSINDFDKLF